MARRKAILCDTPHCGRVLDGSEGYAKGNLLRGLCSRCDGNRHYWRKKIKKNKKAVLERKVRLNFLHDRLSWLFDERGGE